VGNNVKVDSLSCFEFNCYRLTFKSTVHSSSELRHRCSYDGLTEAMLQPMILLYVMVRIVSKKRTAEVSEKNAVTEVFLILLNN
jgi:hypothetical protein